jgi:hypothetical protein
MAINKAESKIPMELNETPNGELDFEDGDERVGRAGDERPFDDMSEEFPSKRVRQAGLTSGETPELEITADDLSPETLLNEENPDGEDGFGGESAADVDLSEVDESGVGFGYGKDEAELALEEGNPGDQKPVAASDR